MFSFSFCLQIRNWFQNRRMKVKRTMQDALAQACQASVAPQFIHYPELQTYRPGPYPRYPSAAAVVPEGPAPTSYIYPHNRVQFSSPIPSMATLPMDSLYPYSSLPGVMVPSSHHRETYPAYPPYYWRQSSAVPAGLRQKETCWFDFWTKIPSSSSKSYC